MTAAHTDLAAQVHLPGRADHGDVRRANLALTLRALRSGPRTRSQLAADTRLTKATVSSLVAELAGRGLVRSHEPTRAGGVGRPGTMV
ncbi:MAG TPA: MarR family transcriptional regulator, partial [Actinopolymorphaceae bacterium]|nr:MarR family transcriptional regulator [Actinopolymorphaceae bacterium]